MCVLYVCKMCVLYVCKMCVLYVCKMCVLYVCKMCVLYVCKMRTKRFVHAIIMLDTEAVDLILSVIIYHEVYEGGLISFAST